MGVALVLPMLAIPQLQAPLRSRRAMLETLMRRLDMVRLTVAAALVVVATGCLPTIGGGEPQLTPEEILARRLYVDQADPVMVVACKGCHDGGMAAPPAFLIGETPLERRQSLLDAMPNVVNLEAVGSSRILRKGQHEGPAMGTKDAVGVLQWITAERDAAQVGASDPALRTELIDLKPCQMGQLPEPPNPNCPLNTFALDTVGDGTAGTTVSFAVTEISGGLYFTNLKLIPGPMGAFVEHPLFVAFGADNVNSPRIEENCGPIPDGPTNEVACTDAFDRFFDLALNVNVGASADEQFISGGAHTFLTFRMTDKLAIQFKTVKTFQPDMGGGANGCKVVDDPAGGKGFVQVRNQFTTAIDGNSCVACHGGGNPTATSAMDISGINGNTDEVKRACDNVRSRALLTDIPNSGVLVAPNPANANHPFRQAGGYAAWSAAVTVWLTAERDAP